MKRRNLLKGGAIAGAAVAAASSFPAPAISQGIKQWRLVTTWPKRFPILGTGAELVGELITKASGGRLEVQVFGAGEIVPAFEAIDAVANGTVEMGHGAPYYWKGKVPAAQYIAAMPFGLLAQELNAWFEFGGGQELADEVYAEMGCKFFPAGNTGVQMGGWYNKEMNTIDDYQGLKLRMPGLGGEVAKLAGATVINLPGGELLGAMSSGTIDAMEWVGPYNDYSFGIHKVAQYYYYPGWHEPGTCLDCFINLEAYNSLDDDLKEIVAMANKIANATVLSESVARNNEFLTKLTQEEGVDLRRFSDGILTSLGGLAGTYLSEQMAADPLSRKVGESLVKFREEARAWTGLSEEPMAAARALDFKYVQL